jgi:DNA-binding Lrp family transcriptional regulator
VDELDRKIAAALQLHGRATWREIAAAVGASESTVARRARSLLEADLVRVVGYPDLTRVGSGLAVVVQLRCEAGTAPAVGRTLAARPDCRFLTLVTGEFDIVLELTVPSLAQLARVLHLELGRVPHVVGAAPSVLLRTCKTSYDWSRDMLAEYALDASFARAARPVAREPGAEAAELDATDLRLIALQGEDGRRTYAELASRLSISESAVRARFSSLVGRGLLVMGTVVDPQLFGFPIESFAWLGVDRGRIEAVTAALVAHPQVRFVGVTTGTTDVLCEVVTRDPDDLYAFSTEWLGGLEGLRHATIENELVTLKRGYVEVPNRILDAPGEDDRR